MKSNSMFSICYFSIFGSIYTRLIRVNGALVKMFLKLPLILIVNFLHFSSINLRLQSIRHLWNWKSIQSGLEHNKNQFKFINNVKIMELTFVLIQF